MKTDLKKQFRNFINSQVPSLIKNYKLEEDEVLVRIFFYRPEKKTKLLLPDGGTTEDLFSRSYPIGKVLHSGEKSKYKEGQFIAMPSNDFGLQINPEWERHQALQRTDAPLDIKNQEEPPMYVDATEKRKSLYQKEFYVNPLSIDPDFRNIKRNEKHIYFFNDAHILCGIEDPEKFIK